MKGGGPFGLDEFPEPFTVALQPAFAAASA